MPGPQGQSDPVAAALAMRASDADRERVAGLLRDAYAEGRLSPVEHEERVAAVYRAVTYADLVPVLHDLPVPRGTLSVPESHGVELAPTTPAVARPVGAVVVRPERADEGTSSVAAVFGGFERAGSWVVQPEVRAVAVFGGGRLDFTEAVLTSQETVLTVNCVFGGIEVVVPPGLAVRYDGVAIFGGHSMPEETPPAGAPTLVIRGVTVFGGVDVHPPKGRGKVAIGRR